MVKGVYPACVSKLQIIYVVDPEPEGHTDEDSGKEESADEVAAIIDVS
jgi:hypothetical protein